MNNDFPHFCEEVTNAYKKSPELYRASVFWSDFNKKNNRQLTEHGFSHFKQTINFNYFQFGISSVRASYLLYLLPRVSKLVLVKAFFGSRIKNAPFSLPRRFIYKFYISLLYEFVAEGDTLKLLDWLTESDEGNPIKVFYKGKVFSEDILNSVLEFYSLEEAAHVTAKPSLKIAELGAGYGRLAYVILSILKNSKVKYCIFDIPPALCVAERYLAKVFPNAKVFPFREFRSFSEIEKEFNESQILFFLPHQVELLPPKVFDVFISISNFPEMRREQVDRYFTLIDKVCGGFFYSKQFWEHNNRSDNFVMRFIDYPIPAHWRTVLLRPALDKQDFFEVVYQIG